MSSVAGSKNKDGGVRGGGSRAGVEGVGGRTMGTVKKKVTAGYHSCTGPEQC